MKLAILSASVMAVCTLAAPAPRAPISSTDINHQCAFRNSYQLISYLNTGLTDGAAAAAKCSKQSGEGYTAGIGRFSTQSGVALFVIKQYIESPQYKGEFKDIYDALAKAANKHSTSTDGLSGFCPAWEKAAKNGVAFYLTQVAVIRESYEKIVQQVAKALKIKYPLTSTALMALGITNGLDLSKSSLAAVALATNSKFTSNVSGSSGNNMAIGKYAVDEGKWLNKFLDTADDMSGDAGRRVVKILRNIAATGFYRLDATTEFQGFDNRSVTLNCTKLTASAGSGKGGE